MDSGVPLSGSSAASALLTPWIFAVLGVLWFLGCGFVLWLAWRAARSDEQTQQETQEPEAGTDLGPTDRAA